MELDLHKSHYFIDQYNNEQSRFANDQVIIADSENKLQTGVCTLQNIAK
jgi:hypothetical protein